jgi:hypothetical protein
MVPRVIASNAHALDAHCTGHLLEFLYLVRRGYSSHFEARPLELQVLSDLIGEIKPIVEEHDQHGCLQVRPPPEVRKLKGVGSAKDRRPAQALKRTADALTAGGGIAIDVAISQLWWQRRPARLGPKRWRRQQARFL